MEYVLYDIFFCLITPKLYVIKGKTRNMLLPDPQLIAAAHQMKLQLVQQSQQRNHLPRSEHT